MGGGDLNSKKSWHPNTMKNQERVWKAEQAAAEEKKRISELQREHAQERDRAELYDLAKRAAGSSSDSRLNWMYDKPDKKIQDEDYLLGKTIEKNYGNPEKAEESVIPAVARRVVGSSMLASTGDAQVDLARKIREDPLLLVKDRERAARAALLNNPLHRKRLADLLRKEQEQRKNKPKKKTKNKSNDLDNMLAAKLSALSGEKGVDIAMLLASDDSSSDSDDSSDHKSKKKKKQHKEEKRKKKKKSKSKDKSNFSIESTSDDKYKGYKEKSIEKYQYDSKAESKKRRENSDSSDHDFNRKQRKVSGKRPKESGPKSHQDSSDECYEKGQSRSQNKDDTHQSGKWRYKSDSSYDKYKQRESERQKSPAIRKKDTAKRSKGLSDEEKAARLAEMVAEGANREVQRGRRVAEQRRADVAAEASHRGPRSASARNEARALPDSLESRIHSNRQYIQRDKQHMNQHFARR